MKVKVGESWFLLYECLGEIVSVDDTMVNEIDLFPPKPKGLVVFDPTRFLPDWKNRVEEQDWVLLTELLILDLTNFVDSRQCPNQQMVTSKTTETTDCTARYHHTHVDEKC